MLKIVSFAALIALVHSGAVPVGPAVYSGPAYAAAPLAYAAQPIAKVHAAPVAYAAQPVLKAAPVAVAKTVVAEDYDPNPQYNYAYSIQDGLTGDAKGHSETRNGDVVQGQYSLVEPDGAVRTVTYTADPVNGFNAVVDRSAPAAVAVKTVAPVAKVHAAPVYAAQPVAAAPVAYAHPHAHHVKAF